MDEVRDAIEYPVTRQGSSSALRQVFMALRLFATGGFQNLVGEMIGVDKSTTSRAIHRVTDAMITLMKTENHMFGELHSIVADFPPCCETH